VSRWRARAAHPGGSPGSAHQSRGSGECSPCSDVLDRSGGGALRGGGSTCRRKGSTCRREGVRDRLRGMGWSSLRPSFPTRGTSLGGGGGSLHPCRGTTGPSRKRARPKRGIGSREPISRREEPISRREEPVRESREPVRESREPVRESREPSLEFTEAGAAHREQLTGRDQPAPVNSEDPAPSRFQPRPTSPRVSRAQAHSARPRSSQGRASECPKGVPRVSQGCPKGVPTLSQACPMPKTGPGALQWISAYFPCVAETLRAGTRLASAQLPCPAPCPSSPVRPTCSRAAARGGIAGSRPRPSSTGCSNTSSPRGAERFGLEVHALVVMSTHYNAVVTDPEGRIPAFEQWLHSLLARAVNQLRKRTDTFSSMSRALCPRPWSWPSPSPPYSSRTKPQPTSTPTPTPTSTPRPTPRPNARRSRAVSWRSSTPWCERPRPRSPRPWPRPGATSWGPRPSAACLDSVKYGLQCVLVSCSCQLRLTGVVSRSPGAVARAGFAARMPRMRHPAGVWTTS